MSADILKAPTGRRIALARLGRGAPVLYLHDFIDVHSAVDDWLPFHRMLAERCELIALAHAGCAGSDEDDEAETIGDAVFHVLEALDVLGLDSVPVVGVGVGGWLAAELAVHHPEIVWRLVLVGATGLYVPKQPIADVFYAAQPMDGERLGDLREVLFGEPASAIAAEFVPDGRMSMEREMLRYRMFRFANRIGFKPPYLYDRRLSERLWRYQKPTLIVWGTADRFVPIAHAEAYAHGLQSARVELMPGAGHSVHVERPTELATVIAEFMEE
jgi:pimeloyl-ACP methyl ester carboxylesterase